MVDTTTAATDFNAKNEVITAVLGFWKETACPTFDTVRPAKHAMLLYVAIVQKKEDSI